MPILDYSKNPKPFRISELQGGYHFQCECFSTINHKPQDRIISSPIASSKTEKGWVANCDFLFLKN